MRVLFYCLVLFCRNTEIHHEPKGRNTSRTSVDCNFLLHRQQKLFIEAAAASNFSVPEQPVTFDPDASWLKFHLGINRYALYSRDDQDIDKLLQDMQSATIIGAGNSKSRPASNTGI